MKDDRQKMEPVCRKTWSLPDSLAKRRHAGWVSAALSTIRRLGANIGQMSWWLLLVLASPMVEGASLFHSTGDVRATLAAPSIILVAQTNSEQQHPHILGVCEQIVTKGFGNGRANIYPVLYANVHYFKAKTSQDEKIDDATAKVTILQRPKHGYVESVDNSSFVYIPDNSYLGNDYLIMKIEGNGYKVQINYFMYVTEDPEETALENKACKGLFWKISHPSVEDYNDLDSWYRATSLYALLTGAKDVLSSFADLSGSALGKRSASQHLTCGQKQPRFVDTDACDEPPMLGCACGLPNLLETKGKMNVCPHPAHHHVLYPARHS